MKTILELPVQWILLGAMLANKSIFERVAPIAAYVFDLDCMRLLGAVLTKNEDKKREWLERHRCPIRKTLLESFVAYAETTRNENRRDEILAELASMSVSELEAILGKAKEKAGPTPGTPGPTA